MSTGELNMMSGSMSGVTFDKPVCSLHTDRNSQRLGVLPLVLPSKMWGCTTRERGIPVKRGLRCSVFGSFQLFHGRFTRI